VRVHAVAGVDDRYMQMPRENVRRSRRRMTDHDRIRAERLDGQPGIDERFALLDARGGGGNDGGEGAEFLGGELE
jgi:hypothetical protein